ncbi:unnamed protein product [Sphenostylis stenocarpa]|uniref:Uncharacterized protein n=1 Tax=Sphenostylis stenocarpa TaxID=92480 RepID=A0AA86SIV2_9FABA|nr:unnamed protein product [Sphenostylis stenocarpa]
MQTWNTDGWSKETSGRFWMDGVVALHTMNQSLTHANKLYIIHYLWLTQISNVRIKPIAIRVGDFSLMAIADELGKRSKSCGASYICDFLS